MTKIFDVLGSIAMVITGIAVVVFWGKCIFHKPTKRWGKIAIASFVAMCGLSLMSIAANYKAKYRVSYYLMGLCGIATLLFLGTAISFLIRCIRKKDRKKIGIASAVSFVLIWVFGFSGAALACQGELTEISRTEATCTEMGESVSYCDECGETRTEKIEPLGHSFEEISRVEATIDANGKVVKRCKRCGKKK